MIGSRPMVICKMVWVDGMITKGHKKTTYAHYLDSGDEKTYQTYILYTYVYFILCQLYLSKALLES